MNQGIAFARTIRALDADDFRASKLGLLIAALLLGAWTWWMLAARVPQYETTTNVRIQSGRAIAYFSPEAISRIRSDQPAVLHFDGAVFPARVQTIASDHAELAFANPQSPTLTSTSASVDVEVSQISPAAIALRRLTRGNR
jgi:hypothetical protein